MGIHTLQVYEIALSFVAANQYLTRLANLCTNQKSHCSITIIRLIIIDFNVQSHLQFSDSFPGCHHYRVKMVATLSFSTLFPFSPIGDSMVDGKVLRHS